MMTKEERMTFIKRVDERIAKMTPEERKIYDKIAEMETTSFK